VAASSTVQYVVRRVTFIVMIISFTWVFLVPGVWVRDVAV
jgi:hypothetical protein